MGAATTRGHPLAGAVEATWLAAIAVTPILFSGLAGDPFELQKVVWLRSLALLALAFWVSGAPARARTGGHRGFALLAVLHLVVLGLSASVSIDWRASVFGSAQRQQGLATEAAYVVFFLLLLSSLRHWRQLERLVDAALVASLPVSLYGVVQRFGTDPVPWAGDVTARVTSSLGNAIFLGGFLVLVVPLTLYRHVAVARKIAGAESSTLKRVLFGGSALSLAFQVAAWSYGPLSGTAAAIVTVVFWWREAGLLGAPARAAVRLGAYNVLLSAQLAALVLSGSRGPMVALAAGLGLLFLLVSAGQRRRGLALALLGLGAAGALALALANAREVSPLGRFGRLFDRTGRVRLRIWDAAGRALAEEPGRLGTGFGPETVHLAVTPFFEPEPGSRPRGTLPDRAHNDLVEALVTTGLPGLGLRLLWVTLIVACGLRATGLLPGGERRTFLGLWLAGGAVGALLARALDGSWRLAAPALLLGMIAGAAAHLGHVALVRARPTGPVTRWSERRWLAAALTSALVAHFVELQFGIGVTTTKLYAWVFAAMLVVVAGRSRLRDRSDRGDVVLESVVAALVLGSLAYGLLAWRLPRIVEPSVLWLFGATWIFGGLVVAEKRPGGLPGYALATLVPLVVLVGLQHVWIADAADVPEPFWGVACAGILLAAWRSRQPGRGIPWRVVFAVAGALALVLGPALDALRADFDYGQARLRRLEGELESAELSARRAVARRPDRDLYLFELGRIVLERGSRGASGARFSEAVELLERMHALSPLDPRPAGALSQVYTSWAAATEVSEDRRARVARALALSDEALARFPANPVLWNERAATYRVAGETASALDALSRSLRLDDRFVDTYLELGELYRAEGALGDAVATYERAVAKAPRSAEALRALASGYLAEGRRAAAVEVLERLVALRRFDMAAHLDLALLYGEAGARELSRAHADLALRFARPEERETVESLLSATLTANEE